MLIPILGGRLKSEGRLIPRKADFAIHLTARISTTYSEIPSPSEYLSDHRHWLARPRNDLSADRAAVQLRGQRRNEEGDQI